MICIDVPAKNDGRFRLKTSERGKAFDRVFKRGEVFASNVYLEWMISYDTFVEGDETSKKKSKLTKEFFLNYKNQEKYPFELSEKIFEAMDKGLIDKKQMNDCEKSIRSYKEFIEDREGELDKSSLRSRLNGIEFKKHVLKLNIFRYDMDDGTFVNVAIEKQQFAYGFQPMIYFCIPITSFEKGDQLLGKRSHTADVLSYHITKSNVSNLLQMAKIFGMASRKHQYDILEIIKLLKKLKGW